MSRLNCTTLNSLSMSSSVQIAELAQGLYDNAQVAKQPPNRFCSFDSIGNVSWKKRETLPRFLSKASKVPVWIESYSPLIKNGLARTLDELFGSSDR